MGELRPIPEKALLLIPRLASDADGERAATARLIERQLRAAGLDWHDLVTRLKAEPPAPRIIYRDRPTGQPQSWHEVATHCRDYGRPVLTAKEMAFVRDMTARLVFGGEPTERQAEWLRAIFAKVRRKTGNEF
jgi:hypothetical protein